MEGRRASERGSRLGSRQRKRGGEPIGGPLEKNRVRLGELLTLALSEAHRTRKKSDTVRSDFRRSEVPISGPCGREISLSVRVAALQPRKQPRRGSSLPKKLEMRRAGTAEQLPPSPKAEQRAMASPGGWVEEAWSDSPLGGGGGFSASGALTNASASGGGSDGRRGSPARASHGFSGDDDDDPELDPWGEFLTLEPSEPDPVGDSSRRRAASGVGLAGAPSVPSESTLRSGLSSLVQMGQQLVRQHEEQGRGVVRSLWRSLDSLQHLQPAPAGVSPHLSGPGGSSTSGLLARPLLATQAEETQLDCEASGSAPSVASPSSPLRGSNVRRSSGTAAMPGAGGPGTQAAPPSFWGFWQIALLPATQERGEVQEYRGRRSGKGSSAPAGSPGSLVLPLRPSVPRGTPPSAEAPPSARRQQHGPAASGSEEGVDEEEDAEAALMKEEMLRIGRPLRPHWRWAEGGGSRHDRHTCLHKSMEVLPVLAVVALLVLGTVAYFTIVDRVLAQFKAPFSLSCNVEPGSWVQRPSSPASSPPAATFDGYNSHPGSSAGATAPPPWSSAASARAPEEASGLYTESCPFIRDEFNCAKYGLPAQAPGLAWQPESCQLEAVKPITLLGVLRNRAVAFVGDMTVANQFDSFVCQLAQQEKPVRLPQAPGPSGQAPDPRGRGLQEAVSRSAPSGEGRGASPSRGPAVPRDQPRAPGGAGAGAEPDSMRWDFWPFGVARAGSTRTGGSRSGAKGHDRGSRAEVSDASEGEDAAWEMSGSPPGTMGRVGQADAKRTLYLFPAHNVTVAFYHSPFLVRADVHTRVNASACMQSKVLALQEGGRGSGVLPSPALGAGIVASPAHSSTVANGSATSFSAPLDKGAPGVKAVQEHCYPNTLELGEPDAMWASEAQQYDVMLLSSGRAWTEEAVERLGLGIAEGGRRLGGLSLEGLQGQWAFPRAMAAVARWLENSTNFAGTAVFRSFSPHHMRRDCKSRAILSATSEAFAEENRNSFQRYNDALGAALQNTRHLFLNITALSWERADGHPWMSSPARPRVDCGNWCLPGVPDTWNQVLGNVIVQPGILRTRDG